MKIRSSTKIAIGFAALAALAYFGYVFITDLMIANAKFTPVVPGRVNIVGVDPGAGYRIIVANSIAQLAQASDDFQGNETSEGGATEGAIKKRLPIKEMIQTLQGNEEALGRFVMNLNDIQENDEWPAIRVIWRAEDLAKALDGSDPELEGKLEQDLNIKLDGTPLPTLRPSSLENGIIIDSPVTVTVNIEGERKPITGRVQQPYKPRMMKSVEREYADKNVDRAMQAGYYALEARKAIDNPSQRENVRLTIQSMISEEKAKEWAAAPEQVLQYATVVVNDAHISKASYRKYSGPDGKPIFNLTVNLTDEGRRRLWQYSKRRIGTQLLLVAEGVAIAAPRIEHQLSQGELTITRMRDEVIVKRAVDMLNENKTVASRQP